MCEEVRESLSARQGRERGPPGISRKETIDITKRDFDKAQESTTREYDG
jgi:hypothetical protein